jgi:extracellular elastinolytic metalloproteinase
MSIPDGDPAGAYDILSVSATGAITDLDIYLDATHSYVGDLVFQLEHVESGATATLIDRPGYPASTYGCHGEHIGVTLDDEAANPVEDQCTVSPAIIGVFSPQTPLAVFDGEDLAGNWKLTVIDSETLDTGMLVKWCLIPQSFGVSLQPSTAALSGAAGEMVTYVLRVTNIGNMSDVLKLGYAGNAWPTTVSPASAPLAAGAGANVTVQVSIPAGAAAGATDVVTVTLTSAGYAGASDSSTLTTGRPWNTIHLPLVVRSWLGDRSP